MGVGVTVRVGVGVLVMVGDGVAVRVAVGVSSDTENERVTLVAAAYVVPPMVPPGCDATIVQVPLEKRLTLRPVTVQTEGFVDVYVIGKPESVVAARSKAGS